MRFYGIDPERVLTLPNYILLELAFYLPALEAAEMQNTVTASSAPHYKPDDYRGLLRDLRTRAAVLSPAAPEPEIEIIEHDPAKAAEWFAAQGVHVG